MAVETKRSIARAQQANREAQAELEAAVAELAKTSSDGKFRTADSFQNFLLNLGVGTDNAMYGGSTYGFNPITRVRTLLEWVHRGSWLGGVAVDLVADDMTRAGTEVSSQLSDKDVETIHTEFHELGIWEGLNDAQKWSRLYGGAIAVILIDKQDMATPLRLDTVGHDQFKGLLVLDRWMVEPTLFANGIITELGPNMGLPKWYKITGFSPVLMGKRVHHTRCIRLQGIKLPYWQAVSENLWGISVLERLYDRMIAFDSATTGAAQLVHKSFLRTFKVKDLRQIATLGTEEAYHGLLRYVDMMRRFQSNEGVTLIDGEDEFEVETRGGFAGIPEALMQFGQQLAGALQIPLVRLFGMSPAGFSATGESDLRMYYDNVRQRQDRDFRSGVNKIYRITAASKGLDLGETFSFGFVPLWQLTEPEKAQIASIETTTILAAEEQTIISKPQALREMQKIAPRTGMWSTIKDSDIEAAEQEPPPMEALEGGLTGDPLVGQELSEGSEASSPPAAQGREQDDAAASPSRRRLHLHLVRDSENEPTLEIEHGGVTHLVPVKDLSAWIERHGFAA